MSDNIKTQDIEESEYGDLYKQHVIEQYKIYIEMADRISQRRTNSNTFFITIVSLILTTYGVMKSVSFINCIMILIAGILISCVWYYVVNSYKQINSVKWHLVHDIEKLLPISPYTYEWSRAGDGKNKKKYNPISYIEKYLPLIFILIFLIILIGEVIVYFRK